MCAMCLTATAGWMSKTVMDTSAQALPVSPSSAAHKDFIWEDRRGKLVRTRRPSMEPALYKPTRRGVAHSQSARLQPGEVGCWIHICLQNQVQTETLHWIRGQKIKRRNYSLGWTIICQSRLTSCSIIAKKSRHLCSCDLDQDKHLEGGWMIIIHVCQMMTDITKTITCNFTCRSL